MNYTIIIDEKDPFNFATGSELVSLLPNSVMINKHEEVVGGSSSAMKIKELTVIALAYDALTIEKSLRACKKSSLILNLQPHTLAFEPSFNTYVKTFKGKLKAILTPIYSWFGDLPTETQPTIDERIVLADKNVVVRDGIKLIKYLGSIPKKQPGTNPISSKCGLVAIALQERKDYDWCLVREALDNYSLHLIHFENFDLGTIPLEVASHKHFNTIPFRSVGEICAQIELSKGVIALPTMTSRIFVCSDVSVLLPIHLRKISQMLQENPLVNVRKSVLGVSDVAKYRNIWREVMTGVLDVGPTLDTQQKTLTTENYPGLYINDGSPLSLVNIIKNIDEIK